MENYVSGYYPGSSYAMSTAYSPSSCCDGGYYSNVVESPEDHKLREALEKEQEKQRQKYMTEEQKRREKEIREWTMAKLPDYKKLKIMKITKQLLKQYYFEMEVKHLMAGLKWFLFFLGLAVLVNFSKILELIRFFIKH